MPAFLQESPFSNRMEVLQANLLYISRFVKKVMGCLGRFLQFVADTSASPPASSKSTGVVNIHELVYQ